MMNDGRPTGRTFASKRFCKEVLHENARDESVWLAARWWSVRAVMSWPSVPAVPSLHRPASATWWSSLRRQWQWWCRHRDDCATATVTHQQRRPATSEARPGWWNGVQVVIRCIQMWLSVLVLKLCTVISTLRWAILTDLWIEFCHAGPILLCVYLFAFICVYFVCFCFILHSCCITVSTVWWTWWDWSLILRSYLPSVLWHCWLGHLTR